MGGHVAAKEFSAFGGGEEVEEAVDRRREALDGGVGGLAQECVRLGEGVFDRIEVGRVGPRLAAAASILWRVVVPLWLPRLMGWTHPHGIAVPKWCR
jgi:hypothetical protein